jgi:hypothetical protein
MRVLQYVADSGAAVPEYGMTIDLHSQLKGSFSIIMEASPWPAIDTGVGMR